MKCDYQLIFSRLTHNHEHVPVKRFAETEVRRGLKRVYQAYSCEKPGIVIAREIRNVGGRKKLEKGFKKVKRFRKVISRQKLKKRGQLPKDKHEVIKVLEGLIDDDNTPGAELVRRVEGNIVMLATDESLNLLSENCKQLFSDGTFRYAPKDFSQLYSFHIFREGYYVPVAYFLVRRKNEDTYVSILEMLKDECNKLGLSLNVQYFSLDFEQSAINAIRHMFGPDIPIRTCRFHLCQSWMKKIGELGLKTVYRSRKSEAGQWMRKCFGLPGICIDSVTRFFNDHFVKTAPLSQNVQNFKSLSII